MLFGEFLLQQCKPILRRKMIVTTDSTRSQRRKVAQRRGKAKISRKPAAT